MPVLRKRYITREYVRRHPGWLFVFGDNELRKGLGGQAREMRGEKNAVGIRTKRAPEPDAYWSDDDFITHRRMIDADLEPIEKMLSDGGIVVLPTRGIGSGLAKMKEHCPRLFIYLQKRLHVLEELG